jgi:hypothetical protein
VAQLEWLGTAFDDHAHLADVRRIATGKGRHNIHNVGIFLWRAAALELTRVKLTPDPGSLRRFRFHPLGIDQRLFGKQRAEAEITHLAQPSDVPLPLTRRVLKANLDHYYGPDRSLLVGLLGAPTPGAVRVCDLSDLPGGDWAHAPDPGVIAVDPVLGRVYFPQDVTGNVTAIGTYHYGSTLDIGGGGYSRRLPALVAPETEPVPASGGEDLAALLDADGGTVQIEDNWVYPAPAEISAAQGKTVVLRCANWHRAHLTTTTSVKLTPADDATIVLDGLIISGGPLIIAANADIGIRKVVLRHCTLVPGLTRTTANEPGTPGAASLIIEHPFATVELERCVLGPVTAVEGAVVKLTDCVIDAGSAELAGYQEEGLVILEACTVFGGIEATEVEISNSIVLGLVAARRRQSGCVRFSYLPAKSLTPRQYSCVSAPRPDFTSLRFSDVGYAQLRRSTSDSVRRGADNESEMGVGNYLFAPQREANLRLRLDEYLRFGLEAGIFYAT